jgi:Lon protease-like protein
MDAALDPELLRALPIFPLPGIVLLPGGLLPLHIFEPRYRALTADVLAGTPILAMARLRPDHPADAHGRPAVDRVVGAGRVVAAERLPDGRYHLLLRGIGRLAIDEEHEPTRAYRLVRATTLLDRAVAPAELAPRVIRLRALCDRFSLGLEGGGDELRELARASEDPGELVDALAAVLVTESDDRQRLLETVDPAERLDTTLAHLAGLIAEGEPHDRQRN